MATPLRINAYSTLAAEARPSFATQVIARPLRRQGGRLDAEVGDHLRSMASYVAEDVAPGPALDALTDHIRHVWWHYAFETDGDHLDDVRAWAKQANAIWFSPDDGLVDPLGRPLLPADGTAPGRVPCTDAALARMRAQREAIAARGVQVPASVGPTRSEAEVVARDAGDVALRALGLTLTAYFAGAVLTQNPEQLNAEDMRRDYPRTFDALTAREAELFRYRKREAAETRQWDVAAAESLLWALGELPGRLPDGMPAGHAILAAALTKSERAFLDAAALRPLPELLDEAEREHALAGASGLEAHGLQPTVVGPRERALRWLLDPRLTSWDAA